MRALFAAALLLVVACSDDTAEDGPGGAGGENTATTGGADSGGGGGGAAGGGGSTGTAGAAECAPGGETGRGDGLAALSDTFGGASLDPCWTVFNDSVVEASVEGGALSLELTNAALWFNASQGALVYKTVTGDFRVTAKVHARKTSAPQEAPDSPVHLGGLMARDPASDEGQENYVFIVVGYDENDVSVETKTTTNDASTYEGPTWPSTDAELRLCRVGDELSMYKREVIGGEWVEAASYSRPDLPETLQVGPNIYSLMQPDLTVTFEEVTFAPVGSEADCTL